MSSKTKTDALISIIVPVYRVEQYLSTCLESLTGQTYRNMEIILIDDGSPDNCGSICDNWAKKDSRIKVIHQKNSGLSCARNAGLDICKGDYIVFIDSDDYITKDALDAMYKDITKTKADISIFDYVRFADNAKTKNHYPKKHFIVSGKEKFNYIAPSEQFDAYNNASVVQWNKIYKSSVFKKIRFPEGKLNEDEFVIAEEFGAANIISYNLTPVYYYRQRENSIISSFSIKRLDYIDAINCRIDYYQNHGLDALCMGLKQLKINYLSVFVKYYFKTVRRNKNYSHILKTYIDNNAADAKTVLQSRIPLRSKLKIHLLLRSPALLALLYAFSRPKERPYNG